MPKKLEIDKEITNREFELILIRQGMSQAEFCKKIFKAHNFCSRTILSQNPVSLRWVDNLIEIIGEVNYNLALNRIRQTVNKILEANKPDAKIEPVIKENKSEKEKPEKHKRLISENKKIDSEKSKNLSDNKPENTIFNELGL